jgi:hypothetical protein
MLLNEFLKEHCKVEEQSRGILEQRATITELKKGMATVVTELKEQASQIQRLAHSSPQRVRPIADFERANSSQHESALTDLRRT